MFKFLKLKTHLLHLLKNNKITYVSLFLRVAGLVGRVVLMFFLAKNLSVEEMGFYGLFTATITYALFIVGADFYTFSEREILKSTESDYSRIIKNHFIFFLCSYLFVFLSSISLFIFKIISWKWVSFFYLLLFLENFSQELFRLLVSLKKVVLAQTVAFFRLGAWTYLLFFYAFFNFHIGLNEVFIFWILGSLTACLIGMWYLIKQDWFQWSSAKVDFFWIKKGIIASKMMFANTLCWRALFSMDRYILLLFTDTSTLGIYSFYSNFSNSLLTLLDTGILSQYYPNLVQSYQNQKKDRADLKMNIVKKIIQYGIAFSLIIIVLVYSSFFFIQTKSYSHYWYILILLLISNLIQSISFVPHYVLYALNKDKSIMVLSIQVLAIFCILSICMSYLLGIIGICFSFIISFLFLAVRKFNLTNEL